MSLNEARAPRRFQFSLVMLLAVTGWAAIVCIALKTPTPVWAAAVFLLTLLATLAGGLGILYRTGRARVFAVGFFAGCLSYAACLFVTEKHFGGQFANESEMPTTTFASWLFDQLHPESASMIGGMMGGGGGMGGGFFSVDSSLSADQGVGGDPVAAGGGEVPPEAMPGGSANEPGSAGDPGAGSEGMGVIAAPGMTGAGGPPPPATPVITIYYFKQFAVIVHSALAVLVGLAGGVIAQIFYAARRDTPTEREPREI